MTMVTKKTSRQVKAGLDRLSAKAAAETQLAPRPESREDAQAASEQMLDLAAERQRMEREDAEAAAAERIDLLQVIRDQERELPPALQTLEAVENWPDGPSRDNALIAARQDVHDATLFPLEIASWQLLIEMQRPKDRMGMFHKVESQIQAEQYLTVVGRVLMCGPTAFEGKTESGIVLKFLTKTIETPEQLIGKFIIMQRYTGNDLYFAPMPGKKLRIITLTEILAVTTMASLWMKG